MALAKRCFAKAMPHFAVGSKSAVSLVDSAIEIFTSALDLDAGLNHGSAPAYRALVPAGHFLDEPQEADRPPVN